MYMGANVHVLWVSIYYTNIRCGAGLFKRASDGAQQSDPPAFKLGCRREQNTEGLER